MVQIPASVDLHDLIGISVEDEKGNTIGKVIDFIINSRNGRLLAACIKPTKNPLTEKFPRDDQGNVLILRSVIKSIDTSLIISEEKVRMYLIKKKLQEEKDLSK